MKKMLTSVYDAHQNSNKKKNDKRVIGTVQLYLPAVLKLPPKAQPHVLVIGGNRQSRGIMQESFCIRISLTIE